MTFLDRWRMCYVIFTGFLQIPTVHCIWGSVCQSHIKVLNPRSALDDKLRGHSGT